MSVIGKVLKGFNGKYSSYLNNLQLKSKLHVFLEIMKNHILTTKINLINAINVH